MDDQVAGDVGAGQAQVARCGDEVLESALVDELEVDLGVLRAGGAPVVGGEAHRHAAAHQVTDDVADLELGLRRGGHDLSHFFRTVLS